MTYIQVLEDCLGKKAQIEFLPMQDGDIAATYADVDNLEADLGFRPKTTVETGITHFVTWYKDYYKCG